ncbi:L-fucose/L-arabinose isomerase family protein [Robinsoniella peoriensis]|uniref:L-fucose/L-arabinose isomerase family protein n=1 Tax=Robinsoniella peoriensis TaxID=180332 RepID=UPI003752601E
MKQLTFALYFANRGFFPETLIAGARKEMAEAVTNAGFQYLIPDEEMTRYGAVETRSEGKRYAAWLKSHEGEYDGVIMCLPNFGDENGGVAAIQDAGVPILLHAYPDEIGKMDFEHRRDSYCGKFSFADVFHQYGIPFTMLEPHVVHPLTKTFADNLRDFAGICRVVNGMKRFSIGAIGARTSKFKTVRFDEITLQKYGITVETFDLSELIFKVQNMDDSDSRVTEKVESLVAYTDFSCVPADKTVVLAKVSIVIDEYIADYDLDCIALRCWDEMHEILGIAPCVLLSELNDRGIVASCEIDLCSAINMYAMQLASGRPTTVLDWNNNYTDDPDKVILFHCGPVAQSLMTEKGTVTDHKMFAKGNPGCGWGSNEGRIKAFPMTYSNCKTENGKLTVYAGEGKFTEDPIEDGYFGCGGVAVIENLQPKLIQLGQNGYRHHTAVGMGHMKKILKEAFIRYLGYDWMEI